MKSLNTLEPPKAPNHEGWTVSVHAVYVAPHPEQAADWFRGILRSDLADDFVHVDVVDEKGRRENFVLHPAEYAVVPKKTLYQDGYIDRPNAQFFLALAEASVLPEDDGGITDFHDAAVSGLKQIMEVDAAYTVVWWKLGTDPIRFENDRDPVIFI